MKTIVGMFEQTGEANRAIDDLQLRGFGRKEVSVLARKEVLKESGLDVPSGVEVGAITGATAGGVAGLLIGLGAIVIPGIGPVIAAGEFLTWIGATVLGLAAGAIGGGLVGGLISLGLPRHEAEMYAEGVKQGKILVTVHTTDERAAEAESVLQAYNAIREYRGDEAATVPASAPEMQQPNA